ncbi:MAG TPA: hypothetical protein G4N95_06630 [Anaerolineae bacterium]|nr:hypothetical protein [Anaerolineae bacterium]
MIILLRQATKRINPGVVVIDPCLNFLAQGLLIWDLAVLYHQCSYQTETSLP